jgi:WD40 repeat protein
MVSIRRLWLYQDPYHVHAFAWSPDGTRIVSSRNKSVFNPHRESVSVSAKAHVWQAFTGEAVCRYQGQSDAILALAWSPDGEWIASAGEGMTQVWQAHTGQLRSWWSGGGVGLLVARRQVPGHHWPCRRVHLGCCQWRTGLEVWAWGVGMEKVRWSPTGTHFAYHQESAVSVCEMLEEGGRG